MVLVYWGSGLGKGRMGFFIRAQIGVCIWEGCFVLLGHRLG